MLAIVIYSIILINGIFILGYQLDKLLIRKKIFKNIRLSKNVKRFFFYENKVQKDIILNFAMYIQIYGYLLFVFILLLIIFSFCFGISMGSYEIGIFQKFFYVNVVIVCVYFVPLAIFSWYLEKKYYYKKDNKKFKKKEK